MPYIYGRKPNIFTSLAFETDWRNIEFDLSLKRKCCHFDYFLHSLHCGSCQTTNCDITIHEIVVQMTTLISFSIRKCKDCVYGKWKYKVPKSTQKLLERWKITVSQHWLLWKSHRFLVKLGYLNYWLLCQNRDYKSDKQYNWLQSKTKRATGRCYFGKGCYIYGMAEVLWYHTRKTDVPTTLVSPVWIYA